LNSRQLLLDIRPELRPRLDNFIIGNNAELIARLRTLTDPGMFDQIYIWGPPGSGRSHLLLATCAAAEDKCRPVHLVRGNELGDDLPLTPGSLVIVDDVDTLDESGQITLFRAFNSARLSGLALLLSGQLPPLHLALREDLRTRIGSTLIYEVKPLSDEEKAAAIHNHALQRGIRIDDEVVRYLLRHGRRDFNSLMAVLEALDRVSLEQQRQVTLPLLRKIMQLEIDDGLGSV